VTGHARLQGRGARHLIEVESFGGPEVLRWVEAEIESPRERQVLVNVEAAGVNFADVLMRRGSYRRDQTLPFTPGIEVAGRVVESGAGASFEEGERVVALLENGGGYADMVIAPAERVYRIPEGLEPTVAAAVFIQGITASYAINRYGHVQPGEWVLVHAAAGGVGGFAVQLAKAAGAKVIATASSPAKLEVASTLGADEVLPADPATLVEAVRRATGTGCDVVVDGVGGALFEPSLASLRAHGRYVVVGAASQEPSNLDLRRLMPRALTVCGFLVVRVLDQDSAEPGRSLERLADLYRNGRIRVHASELPLAHAARAHELIETRKHTGKLVLIP
jgi:NADPH2:quinone reductase